MPNAYPPGREAEEVLAKLRALTEQAGRDPAQVGIEVWVSMGSGSEADWAAEARFWKGQGATHLCLTTTFNRRHHRRIPGTASPTISPRCGATTRRLPTRCNSYCSTPQAMRAPPPPSGAG